jgi:hypothetical protein
MLGLHSPKEIGQAEAVRARLPELIDTYRPWAREEMAHDQSEMRTFAHFLTTGAGRALRMEGMLWLCEALTYWQGHFRDGTGNSIAEAVDAVLSEHAPEIAANPSVRDVMIEIVAKLVGAQVPAALGLQQPIATLR